MSERNSGARLHLPDLSIRGFRGIDHLSIPRLGRVTLLTGKNGIGKTTVLDAVRVYAARGHPMVLRGLLHNREEFTTAFDENGDEILSPDVTTLFYRRKISKNTSISIGLQDEPNRLGIKVSFLDELPTDVQIRLLRNRLSLEAAMNDKIAALKVTFQNREQLLPWEILLDELQFNRGRLLRARILLFDDEDKWPSAIQCESLGPGLPNNSDMVRFWDRITLTDNEGLPVQALQLILGDAVSRVAVIGDDSSRMGRTGRRVIVKLSGDPAPVPLKSLGDGAIRLFGVALALANSRNGFLVIDEAENGIHHSVQRDFWRMVLQIAHEDNVQVLATTHSWDCVRGFARAAVDFKDAEGVLVRLERDDDGVRAVEYSEEELQTAAEQGIEVR